MFHRFYGKYPARSYDAQGEHVGMGPWLTLIREANGIESGFFGAPSYADDDLTGRVEIYPHARVIHEGDGDKGAVIVSATDDHGSSVLTRAEAAIRARQ